MIQKRPHLAGDLSDVARFLEKVIVALLEPFGCGRLGIAGHIEDLYTGTQQDDLLCEPMAVHLRHDDVRKQEMDLGSMVPA